MLVGDLRGETDMQTLENLIRPERIWIEPSGRLTIVDFVLEEPTAPRSQADFIQQSFVRQVAFLGLPASHPLRTSNKSHTVTPTVPHIDGLPSLRAYKLLEAIASNKLEPTLGQLSEELGRINKNSQGVTNRLRFLSASVTVGLMSPLMFLAVVMLFLPSILQTTKLFNEVRHIKSLTAFAKEPERYQNAWALASPAAKTFWTQEENQMRIQKTLEKQSYRLESAWDHLGNVERFVIKSISPVDRPFTKPPTHGADTDSGTEVIDAKLMANIMASVDPIAMRESDVAGFPDGQLIGIGILICILWTTVTLGGIVQYFTGTCICNWDGRSLGLLQSFWRATALYLPIFGLAMSIVYCNALGLDYVWYGTQLKRIFLIVPIAVLATTVLWSRKTPLDVISNTVMIPR